MSEETTETPSVVETTEAVSEETVPKSNVLVSTANAEESTVVDAEESTEESTVVDAEESVMADYDFSERELAEELISNESISMDAFKEKCIELKISPEQAKGLLSFHDVNVGEAYTSVIDKNKELAEADQKDFDDRVASYTERVGGSDNFDKSIARVNKLLADKGFSDEQLDKDGFNGSIIGIELVDELLMRLGEDSVADDNRSVGALSSLDSQLDSLTNSDAYYDFRHKDHATTVKKVNELQQHKLKLS